MRCRRSLPSQKPEINEREAADLIKGMGRVATVVVHDSGLVTGDFQISLPRALARISDGVAP